MKSNEFEKPTSEAEVISDRLAELAKKLTPEELVYCDNYISNLAGGGGVDISDYPIQTKREILANPYVYEYLSIKRNLIREVFISEDDILIHLKDIVMRTKEDSVCLDEQGQPIARSKADYKIAVKALELMTKILGVDNSPMQSQVNIVPTIPKSEITRDKVEKFLDVFNKEY